jgi:SAM-dependent methyltransferase
VAGFAATIESMNPWLALPLDDYEGHMGSPAVNQLAPLADLFGEALARLRPRSVAVLGVAGGNGLEHVDGSLTTRVVAVDLNPAYLEATKTRFPDLRGLELRCADLEHEDLADIEPVTLVHAALLFEHAGTERCLDNAISLVARGGHLSVVLQLPSDAHAAVTPSPFASMTTLAGDFAFVDPHRLRRVLARREMRLTHQARLTLASGKVLWSGYFERG